MRPRGKQKGTQCDGYPTIRSELNLGAWKLEMKTSEKTVDVILSSTQTSLPLLRNLFRGGRLSVLVNRPRFLASLHHLAGHSREVGQLSRVFRKSRPARPTLINLSALVSLGLAVGPAAENGIPKIFPLVFVVDLT